MSSEDKRKKTQKTTINNSLFSLSLLINRQRHWRLWNNITEWIIEIKHNTHWTPSEMWRQKAHKKSINNSLFSFLFTQQGTSLEKQEQRHWVKHWNQTQHSLHSIWDVNTKRRHIKDIHQQFTLFLFSSTDNEICNTGATSLSESLKSNTTLTKLYLGGEDKRYTKDIHQHFTMLVFPFINR